MTQTLMRTLMRTMMRTMTIVLGSIGLLVTGCAAPPSAMPAENYDVVSLASQVDSPVAAPTGGTFRLGAGDRLGEALFVSYVAYVRANSPQPQQQYASGENTR